MSEKPTILVLASTFPRWKDDTEPRFVYDLCQRLKKEYQIIVLAPHSRGTQTAETMDGLNIIRYRYAPEKLETLAYEGGITAKLKGNKLNWLMLPFFFLGQWFAIIKILKRYPVKTIHAHWLIPQGFLALLARRVSTNNPAILCTSHGGDLYGLNDPISKSIKRYVIKNVDALTVVSKAMQAEVKKLVPEAPPPTVAPMGTDLTQVFIPNASIQRKPYQLLFVGRLVEKKGIEFLLKALPKIIKHHPKTILNIAGTGPKQAWFEELIKELKIEKHVNFLGRLPHHALVKEFCEASIGMFPFIQEGLGLVTIEAMGCGLPVIVSNIPAMHDIIIEGKTGLFVKPKNPLEIANKVIMLMDTPQLAQNLGKQGREQVLKKFSWEVSGKKYLKILSL